jgi:YD repeat-containing protein
MRSVNSLVRCRVSNGSLRYVITVFSNIFQAKRRIAALLLITALLIPLFFLQPSRAAFAQGNRRSPIAKPSINTAAPPQPFIVGAGTVSLTNYFSDLLLSTSLSVSDYFSSPQLPPEFSVAKAPSINEKMLASVSPIIGFLVPTIAAAAPEPPYQPSANVDFDFDGDHKTDFSRWQPSTLEWRLKNSSGGSVGNITIGSSGAVIAPADFDGDGKTDRVTFNAGAWSAKQSSTGSVVSYSWGTTGDKPVPADYDGNGTDDLAIFRPSTNTWWIYFLNSATYTTASLGSSGDIPVQADYDGDGKTDVAVFRPSNGNWYVIKSGGGTITYTWGTSGDTPVPADYDYDGKTDFAIYRPSTGAWWITNSATSTFIAPIWGNYGDQPVPGDYDGDHKADLAVWRPTNGVWYVVKSSDGSYLYEPLGQSSDVPASSAYVKQIAALPDPNDLAEARLLPRNSTGGTNLYSQNFSWGTQLVSLPGRAGLNMGLGISYNSLVWTKSGTNLFFDSDYSNVSPGFRFGFPTIDQVNQDKDGNFYYVMVTPSGSRLVFKQTAVTNYYETIDSSYIQLRVTGATNPNDPAEDLTLTVYGTDGTQMSYEWKGGAYRCKEIRDRNGNYISIYHNDGGLLYIITDTLGREISVNYDTDLFPTSITQTWKNSNGLGSNVTHTYAAFTYTTKTVSTSFNSGLTVYGPPNSSVVKVLDRITYANGFSTKFDYNGYLQVWKIRNYAADSSSHVLNYVRTDLESPNTGQTDCPRFNETANWVENFNVVSGTAQEVVTSSQRFTPASHTTGGQTFTGQHVQVWTVGHPDNLRTSIYFGSSGWNEGLTIATEDCLTTGSTCSTQKRWTWTSWTQDDTGLSCMLNPRVTETKVGDGTNTKRTTLGYYSTGSPATYPYGLVNEVKEYDFDQSTVLKKTTTTYKLTGAYTDRRIIGLPLEVKLFNGSGTLFSMTQYDYDEGDFTDSGLVQNITPGQHDNTNYSSSFITGRGNLTSIARCDDTSTSGCNDAITSHTKYNTAGALVAKIDPLGRSTRITYADNFIDGSHGGTYAYPTKITEVADTNTSNNFSEIQYRFDLGVDVWARSPAPAGHGAGDGKETTRTYSDTTGLLEKETLVNDGTYKKYIRPIPDSGIELYVKSTVVDTDNDGADQDDEAVTHTYLDGIGRSLISVGEHPGSDGGYAVIRTEYDILGRIKRQSVPTEVQSSDLLTAYGDDAARDFVWNSQIYDWKGRPVKIIPSDSTATATTSDGRDTLISYDGCGCAGGQVTTIQNEEIPYGSSSIGRRTRKTYADALGREYKTEVLNWDTSVYATTVDTFNTRSQITNTRQYDGNTSSSSYRDVTMTYDTHGRMETRHFPVEDSSAHTIWTYNDDGSIHSTTDPRGVVTSFSYNARGLLDTISYNPGSTGIADTPDVSFNYDDLGNRIEMNDGTGTTTYSYDEVSRLTSETKDFADLSTNYTISYGYNFGALASVSNPFASGATANFSSNKVGKVTGASEYYNSTTSQYVSDTKYRAWGALKEYKYTNPFNLSGGTTPQSGEVHLDYDSRLLVSSYDTSDNRGAIDGMEFERYKDGKLKSAEEDAGRPWLDRTYSYDAVGRLSEALTGKDVHGGDPLVADGPYKQNNTYNGFSEITHVSGKYWGTTTPSVSRTYTDSRDSTHTYDAAGNVTTEKIRTNPTALYRTYTYDAAGRVIQVFTPQINTNTPAVTNTSAYDGNGSAAKTSSSSTPLSTVSYYIPSTLSQGSATISTTNSVETKVFLVSINNAALTHVIGADGMIFGWSGPEGLRSYFGSTQTSEMDPRGADMGLDAPGTSLAGGSASSNYSMCSWEGLGMPCEMSSKLKELSGYQHSFITPPLQPAAGADGHGAAPTEHESLHDTATSNETGNTDKPNDSSGDSQEVKPSSVPNPSGNTDGCTFDKDGNPNCTVQSLPAEDDDIPKPFSPGDDFGTIILKAGQAVGFLKRKVNFVDSNQGLAAEKEENQSRIMSALLWMILNPDCVNAFRNAGLKSPAEILNETGLTVAAINLLTNANNSKLLGLPEKYFGGKGISNEATSAPVRADLPANSPLFLFVTAEAFNIGEIPWRIPHETVHMGGVRGVYPYRLFGDFFLSVPGTDDLSSFPGYQEILKSCKPPTNIVN